MLIDAMMGKDHIAPMLTDLLALPLGILLLVPLWRIHARAGQNPALALIALLPVVGVTINALILALADWPSARNRVRR